ncbi:e3 ubiquitin-protein ligase march 2/3 family member [Holotrichia oblita]|uniref:E3 ubiquitin-protein ligase march 2/3 family member n=2 Tax=Holotrichia oblita TaxID=644536 RepID=A0ACB9T4Q2_HOLOL|nr:e3 ubiquitin-protein ligase march 2/3 family member [Holotrichia oblita]KAI4461766.1 e3 ubiquitin-protein ligase march 2/3 family member [Holotrichia oblita]
MENEVEDDIKECKKIIDSNFDVIDDKTSVVSIVCRICFDDSKDENIITPCHCKGTVAFVHRSCLEKWLAESNTTSCELCHHVYETERVPKYTAKESIWQWIRHQPQNLGFRVRRIRCDLIACAILTPLAVVITYICLFSADYYNQQKYSNIPTARWTSISLLIMIAIMLFGYYIWVYVVVGYHGRMWYYWWQRECIVRYIPPSRRSIHVETNTNEAVIETAIDVGINESNLTVTEEELPEKHGHTSCGDENHSSHTSILSGTGENPDATLV